MATKPIDPSEAQITVGSKKTSPDHMARFSYVTIDTPRLPNDPKPGDAEKYSVQVIIDKKSPDVARINHAMRVAAATSKDTMARDYDSLDLILRDGDDPKQNKEKAPHLLGHYFFNASSSKDYKPEAVGTRRDPQTGKVERLPPGAIKSGYFGAVNIKFFGYDQKGNRGIAARLNNIQLMAPGPVLGGGITADEAFEVDEGDSFME